MLTKREISMKLRNLLGNIAALAGFSYLVLADLLFEDPPQPGDIVERADGWQGRVYAVDNPQFWDDGQYTVHAEDRGGFTSRWKQSLLWPSGCEIVERGADVE